MDDKLVSAGKFTGKLGTKIALNAVLPGLGAVVDFGEAAVDLYNGNYAGAAINTVCGIYDVFTAGLWGICKESAKTAGKAAATDTVKRAAKEATKNIGKQASEKIAKGAAKDATIRWAQTAAKSATKKIGKDYGKELGRKMIEESVERALYDVTKKSLKETLLKAPVKSVVEGGGKVVFSDIMKEVTTDVAEEFLKQAPKATFKSTASESALFAATEVAKQTQVYITIASVGKSMTVGIINTLNKSVVEGGGKAVFSDIMNEVTTDVAEEFLKQAPKATFKSTASESALFAATEVAKQTQVYITKASVGKSMAVGIINTLN